MNIAPGSPNYLNYLTPLDSVSSGVLHAAYAPRKLKSSYAGNGMTLRRSSDNTTTQAGFDTNLIVSGSSTVTAGGNLSTWAGSDTLFFDTWLDQSTNARNMTQTTLTAQPQFVLSGGSLINNKPCAIASGAQTLTTSTSITGPNSMALFVVLGNCTGTTFFPFASLDSGSINNLCDWSVAANASTANVRTDTRSSTTTGFLGTGGVGANIQDGRYVQCSIIYTHSTTLRIQVFQNGVSVADVSSGSTWTHSTFSPATLTLFKRLWQGIFFVGNLCEYIFFTGAISTTDRQTIERNQIGFYNTH